MENRETISLTEHSPVSRGRGVPSSLRLKNVFSIDFVCSALVVCITLLIVIQVFSRYVLSIPLTWSDEVIRYTFTWLSFLSAALTMKYKGHIAIEFLVGFFSGNSRKVFRTLMELVVLGLLILLTVVGFQIMLITHGQSSVALGLPLSVVYASLPVSSCLMSFYALKHIYMDWKKGGK